MINDKNFIENDKNFYFKDIVYAIPVLILHKVDEAIKFVHQKHFHHRIKLVQ